MRKASVFPVNTIIVYPWVFRQATGKHRFGKTFRRASATAAPPPFKANEAYETVLVHLIGKSTFLLLYDNMHPCPAHILGSSVSVGSKHQSQKRYKECRRCGVRFKRKGSNTCRLCEACQWVTLKNPQLHSKNGKGR